MKTLAIISSQAFSLVNFRGRLIADLVAQGDRVYALAPDYTEDLRAQVRALGAMPVAFELTRTGMSPWHDLLSMVKLTLLLRQLKPDVTLSYFIKPVIYGTLAGWIARVPHRVAMIEGLGYVFTETGSKLSWSRVLLREGVSLLYRMALSRAHRVIFLNKDDIFNFLKLGLVDLPKICHLDGIGVDLDYWTVAAPVCKPVTFLLAARLLREKGIIEFAQAATQVKARDPQTRFILLGALDPNPGSLDSARVQRLVDDGIMEWPGHVNLKPWMAQASVYVLPSYREGLPRSTQEAMAMGRAVITTDVPGCRETVADGVNGFLVPARDAAALAKAMLKFVQHPELIEAMGLQSRRMVEERFDVKKINPQLLGMLDLEIDQYKK
ncbi:MAG: glycosyltransferase family 4 protein [Methylococcales bacterium]|nr:glycosyltransferase family 4 protein [Methylococcales bacterium]